MQISKEITSGHMEYGDPELSRKKQALRFRRDWETEPKEVINGLLNYGCFGYTYDNEEM